MRWFKHLADARNDEIISEMIEIFGPEAYGVWWIILELIASQMDKTDKCSVKYSIKKWAENCSTPPKKFQKMSEFLQNHGKINMYCDKNSVDFLTIECRNLLKYRDEYSKKSRQCKDDVSMGVSIGVRRDSGTETETETEAGKEPEIEPEKKFLEESTEMKISKYLYNALLKSEPSLKEPNWQKWCEDINRFLRIDKPKKEDIKKVIDFAHDPNNSTERFSWIPNLRSPKALRKHFSRIKLQIESSKPKVTSNNFEMVQ